jgi:PAS domain S-box-containing protein
MLKLKLTQQIVLAIILPLLFEAAFLVTAIKNLGDLSNYIEQQEKSAKLMTLITLVFQETNLAGGSLMLFKMTKDKRHMLAAQSIANDLMEHTKQLKDEADKMPHKSQTIDSFLDIIDEIRETSMSIAGIAADSFEVSEKRFASKFMNMNKRIEIAGKDLLTDQTTRQETLKKAEAQAREQLQQTISIMTVMNILLAAGVAVWITLIFSRKWNVLIENTLNLGMGKPLLKPIGGQDEIGKLDTAFHTIAQELELAREKERALVDRTVQVICSLDQSGKISQINPAVRRRFGYEPEQVLGTNLVSLIHPEDRDLVHEKLSTKRLSAEEVVFECRLRDADGHFKSTEWTTSWSAKDKTFFCVVVDITERVAAENLKKDMLAMISHDLRTPISSIKLVLECAGQGVYGSLSDRGITTMKNAQQSSDYLINMINDLLDVENFEAGGLVLDFETHPVSSIIHIATDMIEPSAQKKHIALNVETEKFDVRADGERLNRTLVNLLGNAVKFAPANSTITLSAKPSSDGQWAEFGIRDEGPGIPPEKIDLVFEKYRQVGTRSEGEKKGSGLGLAICKALVEAHGGTIGVRNVQPKGCEFWLHIPINGPQTQVGN